MWGVTSNDSAEASFTIAELEKVAEVPARTIRYYQSEGLLPRPARKGGQAVYGPPHLERLRSIAALQGRGLRLQTIKTVLGESGEPSSGVVDLLGPSIAGSAWLATSARELDEGELADLLGDAYPDQVAELVAAGYLERRRTTDGRRVWFAPSVPQLRGALEMRSIGTDLELSRWSAAEMRTVLRELCERLVARWIDESGKLYQGSGTQAELEQNLELIRAVAWQSAAHVMAEEIGAAVHRADEIRERLDAGDITV
ncbi:helix-turn-helix domain-containing protein [Gordonia sp. LSe1-13]|uniref:Helix-turn-helix domain-containing protein n=1 Tax=Gordonia sesuvii TaxID=3116777 RepID=A0ABU7MJJ4_9ACTN|nr:helix-turn-helix domain-containing protein [Gordonia sp. LSe1-13]